jgi:glycosyltransferase involved in cell wall biosynthesis
VRIFAFHDGHACAYYRVLLPMDAMTAHGHEVGTAVGWSEQCREYPIISAQRIGNAETVPIWRRLAADHRLVYEIDDDLWTIDPTNWQPYIDHPPAVLDMIEQCISVSDLVTVSTDRLAEVVGQFNSNVVVIPNCIDARLLDVERSRCDRLTVGWAGGASHLRDMEMIASELRRFLRRNPQVEFHNVGTDFREYAKVRGRWTDWQADMWDYYRTVDFDIGLAPLVESPFNRSKSHIKCLEYAALGIPVIASDVEPYRSLVLDGVTGFLIRHDHDWGRRLYELTHDTAMREEMGVKAREVAAQWTIQDSWQRWESAYSTLVR